MPRSNAVRATPVTFAEDEWVIRSGKVFEVGEYPDKGFSLDESEADAAIAAFTEAPIDCGHPIAGSPLDGKLGSLVSLRREGTSLYGDVKLPKWLDALLGEGERKVSAAWDAASKRLVRLSLVTEPRISDAALFSAYTQFAGARNSAADRKTIQAVHDHSVNLGAACDMKNVPAEFAKERRMSFKDRVMAWFSAGMPEQFEETAPPPPQPEPPVPQPEPQPNPELTRLRAELQQARAESVRTQAEAFADGEIAARRAYPAEREALCATFSQAALDDAALGAVTFGADTKTRVQLLREQQAARPAHELTQELMTGDAAVFANQQETDDPSKPKPPSRERVKQLLELTPAGRAIARDRQN